MTPVPMMPSLTHWWNVFAPICCLREQLHPLPDNKYQTTNRTGRLCYPAYCSIPGNDRADTLAKVGAVKEQTEGASTHGEAKTGIRQVMKNRWQAKYLDSRIPDSYHQLTRKEQVSVLPPYLLLDTRLQGRLHTKLKMGPTAEWFLWCRT